MLQAESINYEGVLRKLSRPNRGPICTQPFCISEKGAVWAVSTDARIALAFRVTQTPPPFSFPAESRDAIFLHQVLFSGSEQRYADASLFALRRWAGDPAWVLNGSADSRPGYLAGIVINRTMLARALDGVSADTVQIERGRDLAGNHFVRISDPSDWRAVIMEVTGLPAHVLGNAGVF